MAAASPNEAPPTLLCVICLAEPGEAGLDGAGRGCLNSFLDKFIANDRAAGVSPDESFIRAGEAFARLARGSVEARTHQQQQPQGAAFLPGVPVFKEGDIVRETSHPFSAQHRFVVRKVEPNKHNNNSPPTYLARMLPCRYHAHHDHKEFRLAEKEMVLWDEQKARSSRDGGIGDGWEAPADLITDPTNPERPFGRIHPVLIHLIKCLFFRDGGYAVCYLCMSKPPEKQSRPLEDDWLFLEQHYRAHRSDEIPPHSGSRSKLQMLCLPS